MTRWATYFSYLALALAATAGPGLLRAGAVNIGTGVIATPAIVTLTQNGYRWYENIDNLTPTTPLAAENSSTATVAAGTVLRLRLNVEDSGVELASGATFRLQYANSTSGAWTDLSTSTAWVFFGNLGVADGQPIIDTALSDSDIGESYGESNPTAATPNTILQTQKGEWDWVLGNNSASTASDWFFRMIYSSGAALDFYSVYPRMQGVAPSPPPSGGGPPSPGSGGGGGGIGYIQPPAPPGKLPVPPPLLPPPLQCADLNGDNRVDIVDLSILLFYYGDIGRNLGCVDLNKNDIVDFPDISIMMYYWVS